jgi:hypothetical protein
MDANRFLLGVLFSAILPLFAPAADESPTFGSILDTGRHVFQDVQVIRVTPTHLFFRHSQGVASLPISQLPPEVRVQIEGRTPQAQPNLPQPAPQPSGLVPPAAPQAPAPVTKPFPSKSLPCKPVTKRTLWVLRPAQNSCRSPLGTGAFPGIRGLPFNWFVVHPCVFPQTLVNSEWRDLAKRDFLTTAAWNNPALLTRHILDW